MIPPCARVCAQPDRFYSILEAPKRTGPATVRVPGLTRPDRRATPAKEPWRGRARSRIVQRGAKSQDARAGSAAAALAGRRRRLRRVGRAARHRGRPKCEARRKFRIKRDARCSE